MNSDPRRDPPAQILDDDQLALLVRSVADDWRMPPQRLDQPTWRDRTRDAGGRRRSWIPRLARPASAALVATVVLAVAAVWLTAPRGNPAVVGQSPSPAASSTPSATSGPGRTPLPRLVRNGDLPSVTQVMVRVEGQYRLADLGTGALGASIAGSNGPTTLIARSSGGWLCVCGSWTAFGSHGPTGLRMDLVPIDATGRAGKRTVVREIEGSADPNERLDLQYQLVDGSVSVAPDGRTAFFVWTTRNGGEGWTSGIDVIDVATGTVVGVTALPITGPAAAEGGPISRNAPSVKLSPAGDRIMLSGFWFVEDPNDPTPAAGTDRWTATLAGQVIGHVTALAGTAADDCGEFDSGLIDSERYYLICAAQFGELTVRRLALDGSEIGTTSVDRTEQEYSGGSLVARAGDGLYIWDPVAAVLVRVDLATGSLTSSPAASASTSGPLDAVAALGRRLGRWIAPPVQAKLLLDPGIVLSPDGTRVYAIGVSSPGPSGRGTSGVFAFDAASLAPAGQWAPTADFTTIAVSADGRFVYAGATAGVDAAGAPSRDGASVTVFDASDGSVRLIAGLLGTSDLWFANPVLE